MHVPAQRAEAAGGRALPLLAAIACGGALGAVARHALGRALPVPADGFPWAVLLANGLGCALIGVLMVLISEGGRQAPHPLVRPFLGVGVLGGFTTFSTYAVDVARLLEEDAPGTAMAYLAGTLAGALGAVVLGAWATRAVVRRRARSTGGVRSAAGADGDGDGAA
ncbi:CrcB family protein [Streptomyces sp. JJ36]|uniref:fluoride efflux transporter FluC n=1 Tax=Streptomyces sp. JJ36 TaxID=2736645 RepID=UPI001F2820B1|nr:CrcB family protein [Streptomyces sp. JJ36]MCF6523628.1 CrcB family protein [Streptomyces sp. JJ36]